MELSGDLFIFLFICLLSWNLHYNSSLAGGMACWRSSANRTEQTSSAGIIKEDPTSGQ